MWTREQLKTRAKEVLRTSYWKAFLMSFILAILGGSGGSGGSAGGSIGSGSANFTINGRNIGRIFDISLENSQVFIPFIVIFIMIILFIVSLALAFGIFVASPLEVGGRRYFVRAAEREVNMNHIGYSFNKTRYLDIVMTMFYRGVLIFLWTLLLIIPGIIKSYAYSMVPYILANNPNIGYKRALELSNQMTRGEKWNMFILDLSFLGWYILGALAFFIGMFFVQPYADSTKAELYLVLRKKAIEQGMSSYGELRIG